jgi:hypothetical protein
MPILHDGNLSTQPDANNIDDSSPSSGLSGSTLNNGSPPSQEHEIDSLLQNAEGSHEQQYIPSPFAYYDDIHHEGGADEEQQQLVVAVEEEENALLMENRPVSPAVLHKSRSPPPGSDPAVGYNAPPGPGS